MVSDQMSYDLKTGPVRIQIEHWTIWLTPTGLRA